MYVYFVRSIIIIVITLKGLIMPRRSENPKITSGDIKTVTIVKIYRSVGDVATSSDERTWQRHEWVEPVASASLLSAASIEANVASISHPEKLYFATFSNSLFVSWKTTLGIS